MPKRIDLEKDKRIFDLYKSGVAPSVIAERFTTSRGHINRVIARTKPQQQRKI